MSHLKEKLKEAKIKHTDAVKKTMSALATLKEPQPVSEIMKCFPEKVHIATVYRILEKLARAGLVTKLQFNEQKSFYEVNKEHHHHFVCTKCNRVIDIKLEEELSVAQKTIEINYNIQIDDSMIQFNGRCKSC